MGINTRPCSLCALLAVVALFTLHAHGQVPDTLAGDLPPVLFSSQRPYVVTSDVYVPSGKTVTIEAGAVLLFAPFTGVQVQGTLFVKGAADRPVVFTSINDRQYNPPSTIEAAPYDWNGIYLHPEAIATAFSHCRVRYSVDGINALTRFFRLDAVVFTDNGRANLSIDGERRQVGDGPYDYALTRQEAAREGVPISILRDPRALQRSAVRYGGVCLATGGCALGIAYAGRLSRSLQRLRTLSATDTDNLARNSGRQWTAARDERNGNTAFMALGWAALAAGVAGLTISFTF